MRYPFAVYLEHPDTLTSSAADAACIAEADVRQDAERLGAEYGAGAYILNLPNGVVMRYDPGVGWREVPRLLEGRGE